MAETNPEVTRKPLTPRQQKAIECRLAGMTFQAVADEVGYSSAPAAFRALIKNGNVNGHMQDLAEEIMDAKKLNPDWVLNKMIDLVQNKEVEQGALVNLLKNLGSTKLGGELFSDRLTLEPEAPEQSIQIAIGLVMALMRAVETRLTVSLCDPLKTEALEQLSQWSEDDLRLFVYSHFSVDPPKPLITLGK